MPTDSNAPRLDDPIYDAQYREPEAHTERYADLASIVRQLRQDCPWDREQTHVSVKHLLIEEAYEVVEAIESGDPTELQKELGDVLLHVLFHSTIAEEAGRFTVQDVIDAEIDKLVRRHPHVFGDLETNDPDAVLANWERIKQQESDHEDADDALKSALDGVPAHLPSLLRAFRMQEKAAGVGFDFPDTQSTWAKVEEELAEFKEADSSDDAEARAQEFGDLLFALVNYGRQVGINPENALRGTNARFQERFQYIEAQLHAREKSWDDVSLDEADALWDEAKTALRSPSASNAP
ncbi:MAG: nucleoside triphosphate pyrophosphohydrolase [Bacteroidota bacterium]